MKTLISVNGAAVSLNVFMESLLSKNPKLYNELAALNVDLDTSTISGITPAKLRYDEGLRSLLSKLGESVLLKVENIGGVSVSGGTNVIHLALTEYVNDTRSEFRDDAVLRISILGKADWIPVDVSACSAFSLVQEGCRIVESTAFTPLDVPRIELPHQKTMGTVDIFDSILSGIPENVRMPGAPPAERYGTPVKDVASSAMNPSWGYSEDKFPAATELLNLLYPEPDAFVTPEKILVALTEAIKERLRNPPKSVFTTSGSVGPNPIPSEDSKITMDVRLRSCSIEGASVCLSFNGDIRAVVSVRSVSAQGTNVRDIESSVEEVLNALLRGLSKKETVLSTLLELEQPVDVDLAEGVIRCLTLGTKKGDDYWCNSFPLCGDVNLESTENALSLVVSREHSIEPSKVKYGNSLQEALREVFNNIATKLQNSSELISVVNIAMVLSKSFLSGIMLTLKPITKVLFRRALANCIAARVMANTSGIHYTDSLSPDGPHLVTTSCSGRRGVSILTAVPASIPFYSESVEPLTSILTKSRSRSKSLVEDIFEDSRALLEFTGIPTDVKRILILADTRLCTFDKDYAPRTKPQRDRIEVAYLRTILRLQKTQYVVAFRRPILPSQQGSHCFGGSHDGSSVQKMGWGFTARGRTGVFEGLFPARNETASLRTLRENTSRRARSKRVSTIPYLKGTGLFMPLKVQATSNNGHIDTDQFHHCMFMTTCELFDLVHRIDSTEESTSLRGHRKTTPQLTTDAAMWARLDKPQAVELFRRNITNTSYRASVVHDTGVGRHPLGFRRAQDGLLEDISSFSPEQSNAQLSQLGAIPWTNVVEIRTLFSAVTTGRMGSRNDYYAVLGESYNMSKHWIPTFDYYQTSPTVLSMMMFISLITATTLYSENVPSDRNAEEIIQYIEGEYTKLYKENRLSYLKDRIERERKNLRVAREEYATLYRKIIPEMRSARRDVMKLEKNSGISELEEKFKKLMLQGEIHGFRCENGRVTFKLPEISIYDHMHGLIFPIGEHIVVVEGMFKASPDFSFYNLTRPVMEGRELWAHPHVRGAKACFGNVEGMLSEAVANENFPMILYHCKTYLSTYDPDDHYGAGLHTKWAWALPTLENIIRYGVVGRVGPSVRFCTSNGDSASAYRKFQDESYQVLKAMFDAITMEELLNPTGSIVWDQFEESEAYSYLLQRRRPVLGVKEGSSSLDMMSWRADISALRTSRLESEIRKSYEDMGILLQSEEYWRRNILGDREANPALRSLRVDGGRVVDGTEPRTARPNTMGQTRTAEGPF